jgi:hypothetical protein
MPQLNAFLRKSVIVKRHYKGCLCCEISLPIFFVGIAALLKALYAHFVLAQNILMLIPNHPSFHPNSCSVLEDNEFLASVNSTTMGKRTTQNPASHLLRNTRPQVQCCQTSRRTKGLKYSTSRCPMFGCSSLFAFTALTLVQPQHLAPSAHRQPCQK